MNITWNTEMNARLADAAETLITTRDFCGDEREALRDWESENGKLSASDRAIVLKQVEDIWRVSQIAAGAKILSPEQRAEAYRDLR